MLSDESHYFLVGLRHSLGRRGQGAVAVRVAIEVRRGAVGAGLRHGGGRWRRQPAGPLARRPMPGALVARVSGGQAGGASAPRCPERRAHCRARRIGLRWRSRLPDAATATPTL